MFQSHKILVVFIMSSENEKQKAVPQELEDMLLQFTINALSERPRDLVSYAADYFTHLRDQRDSGGKDVKFRDGSMEFISNVLGERRKLRRGTVMGERYNPEEHKDEEKIEINPKTDEQRKRIKEQSQEIFLFRVLDEVDFSAVIDAMMPTPVEKDSIIIRQGDDGDFFYLIDNGDFDVFIKDQQSGEDKYIATYGGRGFFGELALLHNQPRAATIKAATDGFLWAMSRHTFNRLIVKRAFEKRQLYMKLLEEVPQLKPLTEYEKMQVADALQGKSYLKNDIILHEGDVGDGMYFIVEGKVGVRQTPEDGTEAKEIAQLGKGEYFGELALVEHQPRAATVIALEDTKAAFLEVQAFERLLGPCIDIMKRHTETYKKQ